MVEVNEPLINLVIDAGKREAASPAEVTASTSRAVVVADNNDDKRSRTDAASSNLCCTARLRIRSESASMTCSLSPCIARATPSTADACAAGSADPEHGHGATPSWAAEHGAASGSTMYRGPMWVVHRRIGYASEGLRWPARPGGVRQGAPSTGPVIGSGTRLTNAAKLVGVEANIYRTALLPADTIVPRCQRTDEASLKNLCCEHIRGRDVFDSGKMPQHRNHTSAFVISEITSDPLPKICCFANVCDDIVVIDREIHAGRAGE